MVNIRILSGGVVAPDDDILHIISSHTKFQGNLIGNERCPLHWFKFSINRLLWKHCSVFSIDNTISHFLPEIWLCCDPNELSSWSFPLVWMGLTLMQSGSWYLLDSQQPQPKNEKRKDEVGISAKQLSSVKYTAWPSKKLSKSFLISWLPSTRLSFNCVVRSHPIFYNCT